MQVSSDVSCFPGAAVNRLRRKYQVSKIGRTRHSVHFQRTNGTDAKLLPSKRSISMSTCTYQYDYSHAYPHHKHTCAPCMHEHHAKHMLDVFSMMTPAVVEHSCRAMSKLGRALLWTTMGPSGPAHAHAITGLHCMVGSMQRPETMMDKKKCMHGRCQKAVPSSPGLW